jgi:hypothetical protein
LDSCTTVDAWIVAQLDAARTQTAAAKYIDTQFAWDATNFQHELALANKDDFWAHIQGLTRLNDLGTNYRQLSDGYMARDLMHTQAQGSANNTNIAHTTSGLVNHNYTNAIIPDPLTPNFQRHVSYVYRPGAFGTQFWTNGLHKKGAMSGAQEWATMRDPIHGYDMELYIESGKEDTVSAGVTGGELDLTKSIVLFSDVSFLAAPNPTTTGSDIFKVVQHLQGSTA